MQCDKIDGALTFYFSISIGKIDELAHSCGIFIINDPDFVANFEVSLNILITLFYLIEERDDLMDKL
jgi:hypothetical protein